MSDALTHRARDLLSAYQDSEILTSQKRTTDDEPEILDRLALVESRLRKEFPATGRATISAAVNAVLRERRAHAV